jgi:hypothetical protein
MQVEPLTALLAAVMIFVSVCVAFVAVDLFIARYGID